MNTESERIEIYIEDTNLDIEFEDRNIELNEEVLRIFEKGHDKCIEVSTKEPKNKDVMLWYEVTPDVEPNEFYLEYEGNNLAVNYQDDLGLDFNVVNNELIVTNDVSELDFNINENKELEVTYG